MEALIVTHTLCVPLIFYHSHLDVFNNAFNGSISADIINMASLEYLNIAENQFRTVLPDTIANLSSLKYGSRHCYNPFPLCVFSCCVLRFVSTVDNCMEVNTPPDVWSWCIQPDANRSCYLVPQSVCTSLTPTISETMSVTPTFSATTTDVRSLFARAVTVYCCPHCLRCHSPRRIPLQNHRHTQAALARVVLKLCPEPPPSPARPPLS